MGKRKRNSGNRPPVPKMDIHTAMSIVPDDLPDGAYFAMLEEVMGVEPGDAAQMLADMDDGDEP